VNFDAAEKRLTEAHRLNPSDALVHEQIATLYLRRIESMAPDGRDFENAPLYHARAREAYARARQILDRRLKDLSTAPTLIEMGKLHLLFEDYEAAKTYLTKALELDQDSADAWSLLGRTHLRADDLKSSLNYARAAVLREPHSLDYRSGLERYPNALNRRDSLARLACADIQNRHLRA
jgi:tetratricopeptide (TPR) repeat protein